jgi:hypothetical protein
VSQTNDLPELDSLVEAPQVEEKQGGSKLKIMAASASGIAVLAIGGAVGLAIYGQVQVDSARKDQGPAAEDGHEDSD